MQWKDGTQIKTILITLEEVKMELVDKPMEMLELMLKLMQVDRYLDELLIYVKYRLIKS